MRDLEPLKMNLFEAILSNTYTYTDFYHRLSVLRHFSEYLLYIREDGETSVSDRFERFCAKENIVSDDVDVFREWGEGFFREIYYARDIYKTLDQIEERFNESPIFVLQVPVKLPKDDVRSFGRWVRDNVDRRAFLKIKLDSNIKAGCMFGWKDEQYDMSFDRMRRERHDQISARIKDFLRVNG